MLKQVKLVRTWGVYQKGTVVEVDLLRADVLLRDSYAEEVADEPEQKAPDAPPKHKMVEAAPRKKGKA